MIASLQLTLAARYLWGRKLRTFLTTLAILFGALVIFMMNVMLPTMMETFTANMMAASGQVDATITHNTGEAFSAKTLTKVKSLSGVRVATGSLSRTINIPADYFGDAEITALTLTGIDARVAQSLRTYPVKEGRFLRTTDDNSAVITTGLAKDLSKTLGDELHLPTTAGTVSFKIVGLLPARTLPGNEEVLITLYDAQKLFDLPERINTIEVIFDTTDTARREAILSSIQQALGDDYSLGGLSSTSEFMASLKTGQAAFSLIGFLALFMGGFIIFNTFRTLVAERRHDIGMLRAIGASRRTIIGLILAEGFLQGLVGTLAGMGLGYLMALGLTTLMAPVYEQFLHLRIGAPVVRPGLVITTLSLGIGATLLAGLLPALTAGRVTPLEALRPFAAAAGQQVARSGGILGGVLIALALLGLLSGNISLTALGGLLFLLGLVQVAPLLVRPITGFFSKWVTLIFAREGTGTIAQGNLTRQPSRSAITASATMIGLAVIVGMGGMIWSLTGSFIGLVERSLGSDYLLMPPSLGIWRSDIGAGQDLSARLRAIPGVETVSTLRYAATSVGGQSVTLLGIDPLAYPKVANLSFQQGDSRTAYSDLAAGRNVIANGILAAQLGMKPGDELRLSTPTGEKTYRVVAVAGDYLNAKIMTAYLSQANLRTDFRKSEDIFFQINLASSANPALVEQRMKDILEDYPQFKMVSGKGYLEENKQLFDAIFAVFFILLAILTAPSLIALINTLAIGVIERTREIGMMRAIGATRKQVRRVVIAESLLLALIGTVFGLVAGLYLGYVMVLGLSSSGYPIPYIFPSQGILAAVITGLLFGVLAALLPARQAARMDILRALRYE